MKFEEEYPSAIGGFYATLLAQSVDASLANATSFQNGEAMVGEVVNVNDVLRQELREEARGYLVHPV